MDSVWIVGRHSKLKFWTDNWLRSLLKDLIDLQNQISDPNILISDRLRVNGSLRTSTLSSGYILIIMLKLLVNINKASGDRLGWTGSSLGTVTCKDMYKSLMPLHVSTLRWCCQIWQKFIQPSRGFLCWRLFLN